MNIKELAKQACMIDLWHENPKEVVRFAHLIRAEVLEEAAGVCEATADRWLRVSNKQMYGVRECAAAIRALSPGDKLSPTAEHSKKTESQP